MNKEQEWDIAITKIIKAISDLKMANDREEVIKIAVQYMVYKMCQTEEIFNDNLRLLDEHIGHQLVKRKGGDE